MRPDAGKASGKLAGPGGPLMLWLIDITWHAERAELDGSSPNTGYMRYAAIQRQHVRQSPPQVLAPHGRGVSIAGDQDGEDAKAPTRGPGEPRTTMDKANF